MSKFRFVGTSRDSKGVTKVRFTNDPKLRNAMLRRAGHRDINFVTFSAGKLPKLELLKRLMDEPGFQNDEAQDAIFQYVVRNSDSRSTTATAPVSFDNPSLIVEVV